MRLGFGAPTVGTWATPGIIRELCGRADELGYAGLWTFQRLLYPRGTQLGATYHSVMEPMVALGYVAACTTRAKLGVAIVNLPFISPVQLAKQAAAVDVLSDGRLILGLGLGWAPEEFIATGADTERRAARAEEYVRVLDELFSGNVDFEGEFYQVPAAEVLPRPVQRPRPPIMFGGVAKAALERAGRIADGWISSSRADLTTIGDSIAVVRGAAETAGRDPAKVQIVVRGLVQLGPAVAGERQPLTGSAEQIRDDLATLAEQGVDELFFDLNFHPVVSAVDADPAASVAHAHALLEAFTP